MKANPAAPCCVCIAGSLTENKQQFLEFVACLLLDCPLYKHSREQHDFLSCLDQGSIRLFNTSVKGPALSSQDVR